MEANIVTARVLDEQIAKALAEDVIMQSKSALNGKKIYMLRPQAAVQTSLAF